MDVPDRGSPDTIVIVSPGNIGALSDEGGSGILGDAVSITGFSFAETDRHSRRT
jgi:hypothetical protein